MNRELDTCLSEMERRGIDALGARPGGQRPRGLGRRPVVAVGNAALRAGLRGRTQDRRRAPAGQQQRRVRGVPDRSPLPGHVEPGKAPRRAARDSRAHRRAHRRCRRDVTGDGRALRRAPARRRGGRRRADLRGGLARPVGRQGSGRGGGRRESRATGSRRWRRFSATACARASSAACARSASQRWVSRPRPSRR